MLTLYDYLPSQNGWKVRVLLGLLDAPYELSEVSIFEGESHTDEFLAFNPAGAVPVLQLDDGRSIAESNAILQHLAEGSAFLPSDPFLRAKVAQWLFFEQYRVEPTIGSLRFWTLTGRLEPNRAMIDAKRHGAERALDALERELTKGWFLVGRELTIADIAVFAYSHLATDCGLDIRRFPAVGAWMGRVAAAIGPGFPVYPYSLDPHSGGRQ